MWLRRIFVLRTVPDCVRFFQQELLEGSLLYALSSCLLAHDTRLRSCWFVASWSCQSTTLRVVRVRVCSGAATDGWRASGRLCAAPPLPGASPPLTETASAILQTQKTVAMKCIYVQIFFVCWGASCRPSMSAPPIHTPHPKQVKHLLARPGGGGPPARRGGFLGRRSFLGGCACGVAGELGRVLLWRRRCVLRGPCRARAIAHRHGGHGDAGLAFHLPAAGPDRRRPLRPRARLRLG